MNGFVQRSKTNFVVQRLRCPQKATKQVISSRGEEKGPEQLCTKMEIARQNVLLFILMHIYDFLFAVFVELAFKGSIMSGGKLTSSGTCPTLGFLLSC